MAASGAKIVVLLGPPGSGKGTQAKMLAPRLGIPQISTGDMLREERSTLTEFGRKSSVFMDRGELVPDDLIFEMVRSRCTMDDCSRGFILDGFPRTVAQAESLEGMLRRMNQEMWGVIYFEVSDEELIERLAGRRSCESCGRIYHLKFNPPPTGGRCECGDDLVQRLDDSLEVVTERLKVYKEETAPLMNYYESAGKFHRVEAGRSSIDEVHARVLKTLEGAGDKR